MKENSVFRSIITALISIVVTVVAGILLYYYETKKPKLVYSLEKILPFESHSENLSIYHITIENIGNSIAEDIVCRIQVLPATIKEYRLNSKAPIHFSDSLAKQEIDINTNSLNPSESYRVSILATSGSIFPEKPVVRVRGKGVTATEIEGGSKNAGLFNNTTKIVLPLVLIAAFASTLALFIRSKLYDLDSARHSGDQNEILAYLCGIHGLNSEVERFLSVAKKTTYWAELDRLASIAIASSDNSKVEKTKAVIFDLLNYTEMANSSIGIGYYNLARLEKHILNDDGAKEYIFQAEKIIPKLLKTRMLMDPIFR